MFLETLAGGLYVEDATDVAQYGMVFDALRGRSRGPEETRHVIRAIAKEL